MLLSGTFVLAVGSRIPAVDLTGTAVLVPSPLLALRSSGSTDAWSAATCGRTLRRLRAPAGVLRVPGPGMTHWAEGYLLAGTCFVFGNSSSLSVIEC